MTVSGYTGELHSTGASLVRVTFDKANHVFAGNATGGAAANSGGAFLTRSCPCSISPSIICSPSEIDGAHASPQIAYGSSAAL
jgi:hypothetical protein